MEDYLAERSVLFNEASDFSCPQWCDRYGCRHPGLYVSVTLVDLVSISKVAGKKVSEIYREHCMIGFDPIGEDNPWTGRLCLELKKPCHFLEGKLCSVYPGRPIACALFPEAFFLSEKGESRLMSDFFRDFPCVKMSRSISDRRKEILSHLIEMSAREAFLSDFYLFGVSPFLIDLKNVAGEGIEGLSTLKDGRMTIPMSSLQSLVTRGLLRVGFWAEMEQKIMELDLEDNLSRFGKMKKLTDEMFVRQKQAFVNIAYQFDGDRLVMVHNV